VMGGRNSQGGVYRIVYADERLEPDFAKVSTAEQILRAPQPLSAWSRAKQEALLKNKTSATLDEMSALAENAEDPKLRMRAVDFLLLHNPKSTLAAAAKLRSSKNADLRAHAVMIQGILLQGKDGAVPASLEEGFADEDALVRRRTCEAYVRIDAEPPVDKLWPLLGDEDRFVRHAARLLLERIDPKKWSDKIWKERKDLVAFNGIVALCHTDQADPYAEKIFARLRGEGPAKFAEAEHLLDWLRTTQLAMIHCGARPIWVKAIAAPPQGSPRQQGRSPATNPLHLLHASAQGRLDAGNRPGRHRVV
jgi:hypothetical protein